MKRFILLLFISSTILTAQGFDGVAGGLAGNYSAMSRGVNSLAYNPANLAMTRGNTLEVNILSMNTWLFNSSLSLNSYNRYFTQEGHNGWWSKSDKNEIMDLFSDGLAFGVGNQTNLLGVAFNNFAFAAQIVAYGHTSLDAVKKPLEMSLFGETIDRSYSYDNSMLGEASAFAAVKLTAGYAYPIKLKRYVRQLKKVAVGISWNQYIGIANAESQKSKAFIKRIPGDEESIQYAVHMTGRAALPESGATTGSGFGIDLGVSGYWGKRINFSWSFMNLGGHINWKSDTKRFEFYVADSLSYEDLQDSNRPDTQVKIDSTYDIGSYSSSLPVVMRMGATYKLADNWLVSGEYSQGLNEAYGNSTVPRVGVGTEYKALEWLPLRAGLAFGGKDGSNLGFGLGAHYGFFQFDFSYAIKGALWPTYARGFFTAFNFKLVF